MQIIHIVHNLAPINFGIWNAAFFSTSWLKENYDIETRAWVCEKSPDTMEPGSNLHITYLDGKDIGSLLTLKRLVADQEITPDRSIIVTHGSWLKPTRMGAVLRSLGFRWVYVPQGMLEPWSLAQGRLKKLLYYFLFEGRVIKNATRVRAVSENEQENLTHKLKRSIDLVENGVKIPPYEEKKFDVQIYLFMARLHFKKGIVPLVKAWKEVMQDDRGKKLVIAGPDEGELKKIEGFLGGNIEYAGAVYGDDKFRLLRRSNYFILPSYSEGFPSSVLEAMSFGLIPLISEGCNFHHVFRHRLGYKTEPNTESIVSVLRQLKAKPFDAQLSFKNHTFISNHYSEECIGRKLFNLYSEIIQYPKSVPLP
jgi:glycosyltransferase involved in cell wall biosynthesis